MDSYWSTYPFVIVFSTIRWELTCNSSMTSDLPTKENVRISATQQQQQQQQQQHNNDINK
jgi:hypothetical protein